MSRERLQQPYGAAAAEHREGLTDDEKLARNRRVADRVGAGAQIHIVDDSGPHLEREVALEDAVRATVAWFSDHLG